MSGTVPPALMTLITSISRYILNPLIVLAFAVAMVVFTWGVFDYIKGASDPKARETGRSHILWGIIGIAIMFSVFGIMRVISNTVGGPTSQIQNIQKL
ncbi:MAG: hypothetical protein WCQ00_03595 [bacterium]